MAAKSDAARPSVCPIEGEAFRAQCEKNVLFFPSFRLNVGTIKLEVWMEKPKRKMLENK